MALMESRSTLEIRLHRTDAIFHDRRHRVDKSGVSDLHQTHEITSRNQMSDELHVDSPQHDPHLTADKGRSQTTIDTRSWSDRGSFEAKSRPRSSPNDGSQSPSGRGHQSAPTTASDGRNFRAKIPFKTDVFLLF